VNRIAMFYSRRYASADSPLLSRLEVGAQRLLRNGLVEWHEPAAMDVRHLRGLHSDAYLASFERGDEPLASSQGIPWSSAVREATYAMLGGQVAAADHALAHRVALNFARGFHHAVRERGVGFCALNGLALLPHLRPDLRVFVVDCDEHGGNGTEEYAAELPNLFHASIFGTRFGCRGGTRSWAFPITATHDPWTEYRRALRQVQHLLRCVRPDLLVYQAGADCHLDDPKSRARIDERAMYQRDLIVFGTAVELALPTVFLVAGGYQSPEIVARLNENTVRAARVAFHSVADGGPGRRAGVRGPAASATAVDVETGSPPS
jgi:acetoin utilization deacetylase AcuC-like enzyme